MVEDLTLSINEEINFANDLKNYTNDFDFISSLHNLLTNNFKQCKTYETNYKLPLTEKKENLFILHTNIRSIYKNFDALNQWSATCGPRPNCGLFSKMYWAA